MVADTKTPVESVRKPGYDARLQYYDVLRSHLDVLARASYTNDFDTWGKSLRNLLNMSSPYMKKQDSSKIKKHLTTAEQYYLIILSGRGGVAFERLVLRELQQATEDLHLYAKHMFLPSGADNDQNDLSMEEFFGGSDL